jgi:hypothetical protein
MGDYTTSKQVSKSHIKGRPQAVLRIRDVYPGSRILIFTHPGSRIQKQQQIGPIFKELENFLPKKLSLSSQKYGFGIRGPGSEIRKKPIPDPGSRGQKGTGSRIRNTGHKSHVVHPSQVTPHRQVTRDTYRRSSTVKSHVQGRSQVARRSSVTVQSHVTGRSHVARRSHVTIKPQVTGRSYVTHRSSVTVKSHDTGRSNATGR